MWEMLPENERHEYRRMMLAFASLTKMFAQKADDSNDDLELSPIINSKYQETVFQKVFHACAEDIGNTSYDASIHHKDNSGKENKFLIGIKTFGISSGAQKVAQFKANHNEWASIINLMRVNSIEEDGTIKSQEDINKANIELYLELAKKVAHIRNARIRSSKSKIQGFLLNDDDYVETIYHVLMPSKKGEKPQIFVGETDYSQIDIDNIHIIGCTSAKNPTNFDFTDGKHIYRFTSADSQLLMDFKNKEIVKEAWDVVYADDAYALFSKIADLVYGETVEEQIESYSWLITNDKGEVEEFSGFNSFYGVGSKLGMETRETRIKAISNDFDGIIDDSIINIIISGLKDFLLTQASSKDEKHRKAVLRNNIYSIAKDTNNGAFIKAVEKLVFRPKDEVYIPIPRSKDFHTKHPDFFGQGIGTFKNGSNKLMLDKKDCEFNLIFEPSGDCLRAFITQDNGKAIESVEKQSYLGEWILRGVFQLDDFEPLTTEKLNEVGINGIRLYKLNNNADVHLQFIWIDEDNPPSDFNW